MFPKEKQICERKYKKQIIWIGLRKYPLEHLQDKDLSDNRRWREVFKDRREHLCKRKELISHRKLKAGQSDLAMGRKREIAEAKAGMYHLGLWTNACKIHLYAKYNARLSTVFHQGSDMILTTVWSHILQLKCGR